MTVEKTQEGNKRSYHGSGGEPSDRFPVGMRVLAVDDSRACLKVLEKLLLRCEYHVTTTNQAKSALKLLRENKDEFDIVISDVHMPDIDGFKLLEIVGLEMDLPVIMLSANDDTKAVMKGITHGACDYLVKPVRITELKNIWQHVIRRRKSGNKGRVKSTQANTETSEGRDASGIPLDRSVRPGGRKRKDQNGEDEYESEENGQENEDASTQKKQRIIWAGDLHRKFVEAVDYLGIDKAVPKKILELMGGENLTRENVASHLQKYRQLLKKISNATSQQANAMAAFEGGYGQLPTLASIQRGGRSGSLNSPTSYGFPDLTSHAHKNPSLPTKGFGAFPCVNPSSIRRGSFNQGMMPPTFSTSQVKCCQPTLESNTTFATSFSDVKRALSNANYSLFGATNNFQSSQQQQKESNGTAINSSDRLTPLCSDSLGANAGTCSRLSDPGEYYTGAWGRYDCMLNSFHCRGNLPPSSDIGCNPTSSNKTVVSQLLSDPTTGGDLLQTQANPFSRRGRNTPTGPHVQLADIGSASNSNQGRDQTHEPISSFNPDNGLRDGCRSDAPSHETQSNSIDQLNFGSTSLRQTNDLERSAAYNQIKFIGDYIMEPTDLSGYDSNAHDSFEILLNSLVKQDQQSISMDGGDIGSNSLFN